MKVRLNCDVQAHFRSPEPRFTDEELQLIQDARDSEKHPHVGKKDAEVLREKRLPSMHWPAGTIVDVPSEGSFRHMPFYLGYKDGAYAPVWKDQADVVER